MKSTRKGPGGSPGPSHPLDRHNPVAGAIRLRERQRSLGATSNWKRPRTVWSPGSAPTQTTV